MKGKKCCLEKKASLLLFDLSKPLICEMKLIDSQSQVVMGIRENMKLIEHTKEVTAVQ